MTEKLLDRKGIAEAIGVNPCYVSRMHKLGFCNNGNKHRIRATITEARHWLENNPSPYSKEAKYILSNRK